MYFILGFFVLIWIIVIIYLFIVNRNKLNDKLAVLGASEEMFTQAVVASANGNVNKQGGLTVKCLIIWFSEILDFSMSDK